MKANAGLLNKKYGIYPIYHSRVIGNKDAYQSQSTRFISNKKLLYGVFSSVIGTIPPNHH
jgi:hypothetical protein